MNGHEWWRARDPYAMLEYLFPMRGMDSTEPQNRSSRLYYLACARRAWHHLPGVCQVIVSWGERLYHSRVLDVALRDQIYPLAEELIHAHGSAERINNLAQQIVGKGWSSPDDLFLQEDYLLEVWDGLAQLCYAPFNPWTPPFRRIPAHYHSVELLREIFPPPDVDHRYSMSSSLRTAVIRQLAQRAYDSCDPVDFHILADALEEIGCKCTVILNHLRSEQPHVRGCWVLELLLTEGCGRR